MSDFQRKCEICSSDFVNKNLTVRTCGKECSYKLRSKERYEIERDAVEKVCVTCDQKFLDKSKKKLVVKCTPCFRKEGVAKRRSNGSYTRSEEQNRKMVETLQKIRAEGGGKISEEKKAEMSKDLSERWKSEAFREKVKRGYIEKYGVEHWTKLPESKEEMRRKRKGKKLPEETCFKMREGAARRLREGRNRTQFFGRGGIREDIGFYVRSRWEANFARYLIHTNQQFQYEPESFILSNGRTYTPDFKVGDTYFEVKGWWTDRAKEKFQMFCQQFQHIRVKIVDAAEYNRIESEYGNIILNWERKNDKQHSASTE